MTSVPFWSYRNFVFTSLCKDDTAESFSSLFLLRVLPNLNIYLPCRLQTAGEMKCWGDEAAKIGNWNASVV